MIALMASIAAPTLADTTTGNISGTVTANGQPVPNVSVVAVAPSGRYTSKTDAKGFFIIVGVVPDTYSVTFAAPGFTGGTVNGVTVNPTITATVNQSLSAQLKQIGSTTSRATGVSAFQPQQPQDTYSVNANQIETILGKSHAQSETNLIISLPGASLDANGYPVLRGGRENDEGFQFEGIDYTDAFTHQFVNSLALNGVNNFQLSPGAGDASVGNVGTGQINATVKRGARPAFGNVEGDLAGPAYNHSAGGEFGWATPTGAFSSYTSFEDSNTGGQCGRRGFDCNAIGGHFLTDFVFGRDFIENAVFKFGQNKNQSLQAFYQNQQYNFYANSQFMNARNLGYRLAQPDFINTTSGQTGLSPGELAQISPFSYGQQFFAQKLGRPAQSDNQPNETIKLQYSNSLNQSTFMTLKAYKVNSTTVFDYPYLQYNCLGIGLAPCDTFNVQGGQRTGFAADFTKQIGAKHLVGFGGKYEFVHPIDAYQSAYLGFSQLFLGTLNSPTGLGIGAYYDFLPLGDPNCPTAADIAPGNCYLAQFYPGGVPPRIADYNQSPVANRHDTGFYVQDQFQASDRLKIVGGLRLDRSSFDYSTNVNFGAFNVPGGYSSAYYLPIATGVYTSGPLIGQPDPAKDVYSTNFYRTSSTLEPRLGIAYQYNPSNSLTFNYGRSVAIPPIAFVDARVPRSQYNAFRGVPSDSNICGPTGDRVCRDYADQMYWSNQNAGAGVPIEPAKPSTFNNYDMSFQHDFGHGLSAKLTPFYRRGYDVLANFSSPLVQNGHVVVDANGNPQFSSPLTSNLGSSFTTGVEFYMTKTSAYGLSGTLSLTYINEFTNVVPLSSASEDFFPSIPAASLFQGNLYRVGFVSPFNGVAALQYKWRSGWRVNPIVGFNVGYPLGSGNITAFTFNGKNYNLPQTNVTNQISPVLATQYVDPANPGSVFHPNIAATRGTPEKNSPGGVLSAPRINVADLDIEYNKPGTRSTVGVLVTNLFNQIYAQPQLNQRWQAVATGISGPKTGTSSSSVLYPQLGYRNYPSYGFGNQPYLILPNGIPTQFRFYYQLSL
ncbi:MAG TPA: TonB-dependent receptor [Candidatus Elarobacter sp.]|nr:TonB-dependent receptor [Candidatus Elarobacter sp.]